MLSGRHILVAEDEAMIAMLVEDQLLDAGATVVIAATVSDALVMINVERFDAAVLDCKLGKEMVFSVADKLADHGVPFLFTTGYGEECEKGRHQDAVVLAKPYDTETLVAHLKALMRDA